MRPPIASYFGVRTGRIYTEISGEDAGLTLIFLHYFAGSGTEWRAVVDDLSEGYRCVVVDLPGHGRSEPSALGYAVETQAEALLELIGQLNPDAYVLVGHSMSGKLAQVVAARRPAGLRGLVLLAPSPLSPEPIPDETRARLLRSHGDRAAAERMADEIVAERLPESRRETVVTDSLRTDESAWKAWLAQGSREDWRACAEQIRVPVRVLAGRHEHNIPLDVLQAEVVRALPDAALQLIDGAGHLLPLEKPRETTQALRDILPAWDPKNKAAVPRVTG